MYVVRVCCKRILQTHVVTNVANVRCERMLQMYSAYTL